MILDGWGISRHARGNALHDAYTPALDRIAAYHPSLALAAAGFSAGMLWGEPGSSESGHTTIGTGRIVYNHLPRILREIRSGAFFENPVLTGAIEHVKRNRSRLHVLGLVSGASTHSYLEHLYACMDLASRTGTPLLLHMFTDGKDAPPRQAARVLEGLFSRIASERYPVTIASLMGRTFAMDAESRWDRTERAWQTLVQGDGEPVKDFSQYVREQYEKGVTDEFMPPALAQKDYALRDGDAAVFFNFREDGMRQLASAITQEQFKSFARPYLPHNVYVATFTAYAEGLPVGVAFPQSEVKNTLSEVLSHHGVKQLKIADARKIAHLTYFFTGGKEEAFPFETRTVLPATSMGGGEADAAMNTEEIAVSIAEAVERTASECIIVNIPNADAASHAGDFRATIRAVEAVDRVVGRVYDLIMHRRGALLITADHGAAEDVFNSRTGEVRTGHTDNPVPFYFITSRNRFKAMRSEDDIAKRFMQPLGVLADVAPTVLELLGIKRPEEMTGRSLVGLL